jgi:pilus assembly protein Flp/PilA
MSAMSRNTTLSKGGLEMERIKRFFKDEEGATAVEYGLMVAAIAAVIVLVVVSLGGKVNDAFKKVDDNMPTT